MAMNPKPKPKTEVMESPDPGWRVDILVERAKRHQGVTKMRSPGALGDSGSGLPTWIDPFNADLSQCPPQNFVGCVLQGINWPQFIGWVLVLGLVYSGFSRVVKR